MPHYTVLDFNEVKQNEEISTNHSPPIVISSNHSIKINTTDMDPECTPECYLNCQYQFPDLTQEKYCIINVCKCQIINEDITFELIEDKQINSNNNVNLLQLRENAKKEISLIGNWIYFVFVIICIYELWVFSYLCVKFNNINSNEIIEDETECNRNIYKNLLDDEKEEKEDNTCI